MLAGQQSTVDESTYHDARVTLADVHHATVPIRPLDVRPADGGDGEGRGELEEERSVSVAEDCAVDMFPYPDIGREPHLQSDGGGDGSQVCVTVWVMRRERGAAAPE